VSVLTSSLSTHGVVEQKSISEVVAPGTNAKTNVEHTGTNMAMAVVKGVLIAGENVLILLEDRKSMDIQIQSQYNVLLRNSTRLEFSTTRLYSMITGA